MNLRINCNGILLAIGLAFVPAIAAGAGDVIRHPIPGSDFPISAAVEIPAGKSLIFLSGMVPPVINKDAPKGSVASYGDTQTQTVSVLKRIEEQLARLKLGMGDVVKMQVFLVGDPDNAGKLDFAGFMKGYTQFFGTKEQPKLPVRSAFQIAALAGPGMLVEIEVTAVRP
ncbi:MAG: RidA family protein [Dokdonella sp.]